MRRLYGDDLRFSMIAPRRPLFRRLGVPGVADAVGEAIGTAEAAGHWARFGLTAP